MNTKKVRVLKQDLLKSFEANLPILLLAAATTAASVILFNIQLSDSGFTQTFQLSPKTPWGAFTSIFLHRSWDHLIANSGMLWIWTGIIPLAETLLSLNERKRRAQFLVLAVLVSAVVSDIIWAFIFSRINPGMDFSSVGASGLVYAVLGGAMGFSLVNILGTFSKRPASTTARKANGVVFSNAILVAVILSIIVSSPDMFLSKAPGSNVFVHGISFLLAMGAVMGRDIILLARSKGSMQDGISDNRSASA